MLCNFILFMILLLLCFGLGFLLVVGESHFQLPKVISWFCATIRLDLFLTKFWFGFVCVLCMVFSFKQVLGNCVLFILLQVVYAGVLFGGGNIVYSFIGLLRKQKWWFCECFFVKTSFGSWTQTRPRPWSLKLTQSCEERKKTPKEATSSHVCWWRGR